MKTQVHVCSVLVALFTLVKLAQGQAAVCRRECIRLRDCPSLAQLLSNPSRSDIKRLQEATCSIRNRDLEPLVCCDEVAPVRPLPLPLTQPLTSPEPVFLHQGCGRVFRSAIVPGRIPFFASYTWLVLLGYTGPSDTETQFLCTGSLINERYVVTAAHCLDNELLRPRHQNLQVIRVGEKNLLSDTNCRDDEERSCAPPAQDFAPELIIKHPAYDSNTFENDIALIRLSAPVDFGAFKGYVGAVCLPPPGGLVNEQVDLQTMFAVNFDLIHKPTQFLHQYRVELHDIANCNDTFNGRLVDGQICVSDQREEACISDGGSPLVAESSGNHQLLGVLSFGFGCSSPGTPSVFTSVAFHSDWLQQNITP